MCVLATLIAVTHRLHLSRNRVSVLTKIKKSPSSGDFYAMGLLTNPSATSGRSKYVKKLIKYNRGVCFLFYIAGIAWFCCLALPDFNNKTYFSENALLPGLVYSELKTETSNLARNLLDELKREQVDYSSTTPYPWIQAKMRQIGLETHVHNFTLNYPLGGGRTFTGKNIYGILRAPRAASTESFVISVPYRPPESVHPNITPGLPLILAFADFARKQKYWSKDIIFLVTEQEQLGVHAWLEAYHTYDNNDVLDSGKLDARAGSIQAAINLEIQDFDADFIDVKIEGLNGQLPNLDLVNLVNKLSYKENIPCGYKLLSRRRPNSQRSRFEANLKNMLSMVLTQASCVPTGNHGLFHKYGIEAVTLEAHAKSNQNPNRGNGNPSALLRIVEGVSRSLNNLLERFHQSFFFYILVANDRFVSIGDYMPAIGLMAGALLVKSFIVWLTITLEDEEDEDNGGKAGGDGEKLLNKPKIFGYISVGLVIMVAHTLGFFISYLPYYSVINDIWHELNVPTEMAMFYLFTIVSVSTIVTPRLFYLEYLSSQVLHMVGLMELGTVLISVSMMNFSLGLVLSIFLVPFAILVKPKDPEGTEGASNLRLITRLYGLALHPLTVCYTIVFVLTWFTYPELGLKLLAYRAVKATMDAITFAVVDSMIYGNWMFKMVTVIFLPNWIIFWNVIYPRTLKRPKIKTN